LTISVAIVGFVVREGSLLSTLEDVGRESHLRASEASLYTKDSHHKMYCICCLWV